MKSRVPTGPCAVVAETWAGYLNRGHTGHPGGFAGFLEPDCSSFGGRLAGKAGGLSSNPHPTRSLYGRRQERGIYADHGLSVELPDYAGSDTT